MGESLLLLPFASSALQCSPYPPRAGCICNRYWISKDKAREQQEPKRVFASQRYKTNSPLTVSGKRARN